MNFPLPLVLLNFWAKIYLMESLTLPLVMTTGLLDSLNPCAISLLLIYIALLFSLGKSHREVLRFGFFYILAVYVTYFTIGMFYFELLDFLVAISVANISTYLMVVAAIFTIIFGLLNIKEYFWPNSWLNIRIPMSVRQRASELAHKGDIPSAILLGVVVAVTELPCSGSVYFGILTYLKVQETVMAGIGYLAIYNLMFVLPLIAIFIFASNRILTEKMINLQERLGRKLHLVLAAVMIVLGLVLVWAGIKL